MRVPRQVVCAILCVPVIVTSWLLPMPVDAAVVTERLGAGLPPAGSAGVVPQTWVAPADEAPQIDGKLGEAVWKLPRPVVLGKLATQGKTSPRTEVRLVHHGGLLYVAVWLDEPNVGQIKREAIGPDGPEGTNQAWSATLRTDYSVPERFGHLLFTPKPPHFRRFDATEAVRAWVKTGADEGLLLLRQSPGFTREATWLEIAYEGELKSPPKQVTGVKAFCRSGQVFVTFREIENYTSGKEQVTWGELGRRFSDVSREGPIPRDQPHEIRYLVYVHDRPITPATIGQAELLARVAPGSIYNTRLVPGGDFISKRPDAVALRLAIDPGRPLPPGTGLYVHTVHRRGRRYYAVVTAVDGVEDGVWGPQTHNRQETLIRWAMKRWPVDPQRISSGLGAWGMWGLRRSDLYAYVHGWGAHFSEMGWPPFPRFVRAMIDTKRAFTMYCGGRVPLQSADLRSQPPTGAALGRRGPQRYALSK